MRKYLANNYKKLLDISKKICTGCGTKEDYRDVCNEMILCILEMSEEKQAKILDYVDYYFYNMVKISVTSPSSGYQRLYYKILFDKNIDVKNIDIKDESIYKETLNLEDCENILKDNDVSWYNMEVFLRYIRTGKSFNQLSADTNIPSSSLYNAFKEARDVIQNKLNNEK